LSLLRNLKKIYFKKPKFCLNILLVGLELIVDEKTKQIKDDGSFPEYKRMCRKLNVIPNDYLLRHSTDDDIKLRYRYLSKNDCTAMGYEMKVCIPKMKVGIPEIKVCTRYNIPVKEALQLIFSTVFKYASME
jgi:hypothetical protein